MKVHFTSATLLALMSMSSNTDAFTSITIAKLRVASSLAVGSNDNEDFIKALSGGSAGSDDDTEKEDSPGGSKFKELLAQAKQGTQAPVRAIENPFLTQQQSPPAMPANPDEMSVEEQARMFREMMQQPSTPQAIPTPQRVAKTDMAGRPVGRNRDADTIANTADLYFAQLKRDSTVRNLARMRGDDESAQKVFEDEGVRELEGLLQTNPYLKGQREKEESLFDTVPEEMLKSFFDAEPSEEEKSTSGDTKSPILGCYHPQNYRSRAIISWEESPRQPKREGYEPDFLYVTEMFESFDWVALTAFFHESKCLLYYRLNTDSVDPEISKMVEHYLDTTCRCMDDEAGTPKDEVLDEKMTHAVKGHRSSLLDLSDEILRKIDILTRTDLALYQLSLETFMKEVVWLESKLNRRVLCDPVLLKWGNELAYVGRNLTELYLEAKQKKGLEKPILLN